MNGKGLVGSVVKAVLLLLSLVAGSSAQTDVAALRDQARTRFDVVTLTGGVGLVPKQSIQGVRLIEVRDGAVSINGEPVSAKDVKTKLGKDADIVLRVTYLDAAGLATLTGAAAAVVPPAPPAPPAPPTTPEEGHRTRTARGGEKRDGAVVRFGGNVTVEKDEVVNGEVVVMGGTATILGTVNGELVVLGGKADVQGTVDGDVSIVGGTVTLGPESVVKGEVSVAGGSVNREPGSRVDGHVSEVGVGDESADGHGKWGKARPKVNVNLHVGSFFGTFWRGVLLLLLSFVMIALAGRYVRPIAARVGSEPVRSGLTGLLAEVLFVPVLLLTVVVLAVSIIGIPFLLLLPFALVLVALASLGGFAGVVLHAGRSLTNRLGITSQSPYVHATVGVVAVIALTLLGRALRTLGSGFVGDLVGGILLGLGLLIEYLVWTVGLGAAIWVLRQSRGRAPREDGPVNPESPIPPISPSSPMGHGASDAPAVTDYRALPPAGPEVSA